MNINNITQEAQQTEKDDILKNNQASGQLNYPNPLWIFGYGSLCYKPGDIKYVEERNGYTKNHTRRFWQNSTDHRGTTENPGLVCTLLSDDEWQVYGDNFEGGIVYGKVFRIDDKDKEEVLNELDIREKDGYSQTVLDVYIFNEDNDEQSGQVEKVQALLYKATIDNPNFVQDKEIRQSIQKQAEIISKSQGISGKNIEYLIKYYLYLQKIGKVDRYIKELVQEVTKQNNINIQDYS